MLLMKYLMKNYRRRSTTEGVGYKRWLQNRRQLSLRKRRSGSFKEERMLVE